jgi:hypothetical protein
MRARLIPLLLAISCLGLARPASAHHGHTSVHIGVSAGWGWWYPGWYGPGYWGWYGPGWYGPGYYGPAVVQAAPVDVGTVDTDISPEQARVFLNGTLIGTADDFDGYPSYLFLKPGHYTLEFRLQGYKTESLELDVHAGQFFPLDTKLARIPGEPATPWYDRPKGLPIGRVFGPGGAESGEAPSGPARSGPDVSLRPDMHERSGQSEAPPPPVARLGAALDLSVTPDNASVYLDGEFLGTAGELSRLERGVAVTPGQHQLEVMAPGHESKSVVVQVPQGERRQVVVELEARAGQS